MTDGIYGTRSSDYWRSRPGAFDALNLAEIGEPAGEYGIPALSPAERVPSELASWNVPRQRAHAAEHAGAVHFFLDDYRFESVWTSPARSLERVQAVGSALTPDFSLWLGMPAAAGIWQTYRSRWLGAYWQRRGVDVIPSVTWSDADSFRYCFDGLPVGGMVAVSTVGVRADVAERKRYCAGIEQLLLRVNPSIVLAYGGRPSWLAGELSSVDTVDYPSYWDRRRREMKESG